MVRRQYITSILLILCILIGTIYIGIEVDINSKNNIGKSHLFLKVSSYNNKAVAYVRENQTFFVKATQSKLIILNLLYGIFINAVLVNYLNFKKPIDFRKCIRQSIPHYFNGSNYKNIICRTIL